MKYIGYGLLVVLLMSGCVRRVHYIPQDPVDTNETNTTETSTGTLYDTTQTEARYNLKPEPYSIGSKKKDPELLGPQRTVTVQADTQAAQVDTVKSPSTPTTPVSAGMTKSECISLIGSAKFERYSKRFGGESGAIKRCAILKKLKQG